MLRGDFADDAAKLRREFPGKIEDRRRADVSVAIPLDAEVDGLLCAYLPTEEPSGLPAHVNARTSFPNLTAKRSDHRQLPRSVEPARGARCRADSSPGGCPTLPRFSDISSSGA